MKNKPLGFTECPECGGRDCHLKDSCLLAPATSHSHKMTDITKKIEDKLQQKEAEIVESIFPKGCQERGKAILMNAKLHVAFYDALAENNQRVIDIFKWLLGMGDDFPASEKGKRYAWRTELRKKLPKDILQELEAEKGEE